MSVFFLQWLLSGCLGFVCELPPKGEGWGNAAEKENTSSPAQSTCCKCCGRLFSFRAAAVIPCELQENLCCQCESIPRNAAEPGWLPPVSHQLRPAGMWLLQLQLLQSLCLGLGWGMWAFREQLEGSWSALVVSAGPASLWPGAELLCPLRHSQCSLCWFHSVHSTFKTCQQQ